MPSGTSFSRGGIIQSRNFPVAPTVPTLATVDTSVWGPDLWLILHVMSVLSTTDAQKKLVADVLSALRSGIPCPDCSAHYNSWYEAHPLQVTTSVTSGYNGASSRVFRIVQPRTTVKSWVPMAEWVLDLHNEVNLRKGVDSWDIDRATATYGLSSLVRAKEAAVRLQGVIGHDAHAAILVALGA